jgi:hypothetical protein
MNWLITKMLHLNGEEKEAVQINQIIIINKDKVKV